MIGDALFRGSPVIMPYADYAYPDIGAFDPSQASAGDKYLRRIDGRIGNERKIPLSLANDLVGYRHRLTTGYSAVRNRAPIHHEATHRFVQIHAFVSGVLQWCPPAQWRLFTTSIEGIMMTLSNQRKLLSRVMVK